MAKGLLPALSVEADDADELLAAAIGQLDDGADLVKLYLDGPDPGVSPWTAGELRRVVDAVHARGARVTAHSGYAAGARAGAEAGVDALEHGFELDEATASIMAANGIHLVSTLCVLASWRTFGRTTTIPRFASDEGRAKVEARRERAMERCASPTGPASRSRRGPTSAAGQRAPTSWPGRWSSWWRPGWSRGRPWRRRRGAEESSSASRTPA